MSQPSSLESTGRYYCISATGPSSRNQGAETLEVSIALQKVGCILLPRHYHYHWGSPCMGTWEGKQAEWEAFPTPLMNCTGRATLTASQEPWPLAVAPEAPICLSSWLTEKLQLIWRNKPGCLLSDTQGRNVMMLMLRALLETHDEYNSYIQWTLGELPTSPSQGEVLPADQKNTWNIEETLVWHWNED